MAASPHDKSSSSASNLTRSLSISELPQFKDDFPSERRGSQTNYYSLKEIATYCRVHIPVGVADNERITTDCVQSLLGLQRGWHAKANCEVADFKNLSQMVCSETQRPDTAVYCGDVVGFTAETCSSPMLRTERKTTIGAAELLRLQRWKGRTDIDCITSFAFPNMQTPACLTEITVTWTNFRFFTKVTRYPDLQGGVERLRTVIHSQCVLIFQHANRPSYSLPAFHAMIRLSTEEVQVLATLISDRPVGFIQVTSSRHVMITDNNTVIKLVYSHQESESLNFFISQLRGCSHLDRVIKLELLRNRIEFGMCVFKYPRVEYAPLSREEARECLKCLVKEIRECIEELHRIGVTHNDLRLENICFNDQYKAVLIDMDRCYSSSDIYPGFLESSSLNSCMYRLSSAECSFQSGKTDYFQLGWLVAWVLDRSSSHYHNRKWESQDDEIKSNQFIRSLIFNGAYDNLHEGCVPNGRSIQAVLEQRRRE